MTGAERRSAKLLIDEAIRERLARRKQCSRCRRELPLAEFGRRGRICLGCESRRLLDLYHARRARLAEQQPR